MTDEMDEQIQVGVRMPIEQRNDGDSINLRRDERAAPRHFGCPR